MMEPLVVSLLNNSKAALFAAVEIHNKPIFPYRYEVCTILTINSWELLLKAYILNYCTGVKVINADGTTKPFDECVGCVKSTIGKDFYVVYENLEKLYEYRCNAIHFYNEKLDLILYSLLSKNIIFYYEFMLSHFSVDITEESNLILLPIGFKKPVTPLAYLSNNSELVKSSSIVQEFIRSIMSSTTKLHEQGIEDSILVGFNMSLVNENRISNADVIAAITPPEEKTTGAININNLISGNVNITNEEGAKKVKIDEDSLYSEIYTETYADLVKACSILFSDFMVNQKFWGIIRSILNNPSFHRKRYLDVQRKSGSAKSYYTKSIYEEFAKHYQKRV